MGYASRAELLAIARKTVEVSVPGVGVVRLREMSGRERDYFEASAFSEIVEHDKDGKQVVRRKMNTVDLRARLVALCMVDEAGRRMFADDEVEQLSDGVPSSALGVLFVAAQKLNGLDGEAVEGAKENFDAAPTGDSPSA